jgi:hypothetical protein
LDVRHQRRFDQLVSEHVHAVNAAVTGLSALPSTAMPMASVKAMSRFLHNESVTLPALIEPAQEAIRAALAGSASPWVLVVHDWCLLSSTANADRVIQGPNRSEGYDLGTALVVDAANGRPLGPMELRLGKANAVLTTRSGSKGVPPTHINQLQGVMSESRRWNLGRTPVHVVDREADSIHHYREWHRRGHRFVIRGVQSRCVQVDGKEVKLRELMTRPDLEFQDIREPEGGVLRVATAAGEGRVQAVDVAVVLHRDSIRRVEGRRVHLPADPLPLRLVITRILADDGKVLTTWLLMTNMPADVPAGTIARWYAWRWRIESYHKLLKSAGMNIERWEQNCGEAIAKRLVIAAMACLVVWQLQRDPRPEAATLRRILVRLSGRQMKHKVESTAPALLAGLEKLLALDDLQNEFDLAEVLALARKVLPQLFRGG